MELNWTVENDAPIFETPIFTVYEQTDVPPKASDGHAGRYFAIDASDWAIVVPVVDGDFIMVRQWRHGERKVTIEFPGGVCDAGEAAIESAARELREETGCTAGRLTELAVLSTNPAIFRNHVHIFLAEDLTMGGEQQLDGDEVLSYVRVPIDQAIEQFGSGESSHAFTGTALMLYMREMQARKTRG